MIIKIVIVLFLLAAATYLSARKKWDPFLTLVCTGLCAACVLLPTPQVVTTYLNGFGSTIGQVGLIVLFGALLGNMLKEASQLEVLAMLLFRKVFRKFPDLGIGMAGILVGIPVFCDAGYMLLSHLNRARSGNGSNKLGAIMLAGGLYLAHTLVPPTPGPVAVLSAFQLTRHMGVFLGLGLMLSICALFVLYLIKRKAWVAESPGDVGLLQGGTNYLLAGLPLLIPIALMALGNIFPQLPSSSVGTLVTHPVGALLVGCFCAGALFYSKLKGIFSDLIASTIRQTAPIILLTGAGGALGKVLATALLPLLENGKFDYQSGVLLLVMMYGAAVAIKSLQGSSTAAMIICASLFAPVVAQGGDSLLGMYAAFTIGAGALAISHTNDSYFWVISRMEDWSAKESLKLWSLSSLYLSVLIFGFILTTYLFFHGFGA